VEFLGIIKQRKLILVDERFVHTLQEAEGALPEEVKGENVIEQLIAEVRNRIDSYNETRC